MSKTIIEQKAQEILVAHKLDFHIEKVPLVGAFGGKEIKSDYFGLLNTSSMEIINNVKKGYHVSQNRDVVELVLKGVQSFPNLKVVMGGAINGGRKVFLQLEISGLAQVGNDTIKRYITVLDSNDGTCSLSIGVGDETMSCANQFFKFYKKGESRFRHSANLETRIQEIPMLIELALAESVRMIDLYRDFQSTKITRDLAHQLVNELLGKDMTMDAKILDEVVGKSKVALDSLYANIDHQIADKGLNLWGLHSGVTRWTTHNKQAPVRHNGRLESIMCGTNYVVNQQSLDFAIRHMETV